MAKNATALPREHVNLSDFLFDHADQIRESYRGTPEEPWMPTYEDYIPELRMPCRYAARLPATKWPATHMSAFVAWRSVAPHTPPPGTRA